MSQLDKGESDSFFIPSRKPRIGKDGYWIMPAKGAKLRIVGLDEHVIDGRKRFGVLYFDDGSKTPVFPINLANPSWLAVQAMNYKRWATYREKLGKPRGGAEEKHEA